MQKKKKKEKKKKKPKENEKLRYIPRISFDKHTKCGKFSKSE